MLAVTRSQAGTLSRLAAFPSLYLLSALLVLAGGFVTLHDGHGRPTTVDLGQVYGVHLAYQAVLFGIVVFLHRAHKPARDVVALLFVLFLFQVDALFLQHLYGWESRDGWNASLLGIGASALLLLGLGATFGLPLANRLFAALFAAVLFERVGPALLAADAGLGFSPRYVALGWLLAALPLATLARPLAAAAGGRGQAAPLRRIEAVGMVLALGLPVVHFAAAGSGFGLSFLPIYLAPWLVVIGPAAARTWPELLRRSPFPVVLPLVTGLGLALSASEFPEGMLAGRWARAWPLTPFTLAFLLFTAVTVARALKQPLPGPRHAAAFLVILAGLGGDVPEILSHLRYPGGWQAALAALVVVVAVLRAPARRSGTLLAAAASFIAAGWLAERGFPWPVAYLATLGWAGVLIEHATGVRLPRRARLLEIAAATGLPALVAVIDRGHLVPEIAAVAAVAAGLVVAWLRRDRLLGGAAIAALAGGLCLELLALQRSLQAPPGQLVTELGVVVLLVAFLDSLYGWRWRTALREAAAPASPPPLRRAGAGRTSC